MRYVNAAIALLTFGLLITGCSDEVPVTPDVNSYSGANGFVVNGGQFANLVVDCPKGDVQFTDALGNQRAITLGGAVISKKEYQVTLVLPLDAMTPGEYKWVDALGATYSDAYMVFDRDGLTFNSISGRTVISTFGGLGGSVKGTFNGAVLDPGTGEKIYLDGRFDASRLN